MSLKPTVHFDNSWPSTLIELDRRADVWALDHPRLGTQWVTTSRVVKINDDGSFETLNTIYVPKK